MKLETKFLIIFAAFIAVVAILNVISIKLVTLFGLTFSVGSFCYPITFLCTDIVSEVWGKKRARRMVWLGFMANLLVVAFVVLAVFYPPADFWAENDTAFRATLGAVPRILFASMCAYLLSQLHDVWSFHFWKKKTKGRMLWLRNNLSTATSQLIDTVTFVVIAFAGTLPPGTLLGVVFGQYIIKVALAAIDTPIAYLGVKWVTGKWENPSLLEEDSQAA